MTARLLALALTLGVAGAPVLMTVCETACASRSADPRHDGRAEHHSCHEATRVDGVGIGGAAHICGHSNGDDRIGAGQAVKVVLHSTIAVVPVAFAPPVRVVSARTLVEKTDHSPPGSFPETTQLRL